MQKLGISVPVIEKALNHTSGTFRGIVGVYQRHDYADEISARAAALGRSRGGDRRCMPGKVVLLRGRKGA